MPGSVYVFNITSSVTSLVVNGALAGAIAGWQSTLSGQPYTPAAVVVPRVVSSGDGAGFNGGNNAVQVEWPMTNASFNINIPMPPEGPSLEADLLLYVTFGLAMLEDSFGNVLGIFQLQL